MKNIQIKKLILLITSFLMGSPLMSAQSKEENLPVIDFTKNYPSKKIHLQSIADVEYVPLETTDDILLSDQAGLSAVTDKYILLYEAGRGDIFVFNRNGKIYSHFNHKGSSGHEYNWIKSGVILDEKKEEIFVCSQSIQVYSLTGEYRRTLKINTFERDMSIFNFDDEALLIYEDVVIAPGLENKTKNKPYSLISKKDGSLISILDIHLPTRYSTRMANINKDGWGVTFLSYPNNMYYGQDFVIADISSDTLSILTQNRKLTPILTRKPSVHASETRTVWAPFLTTDKFILIGLIRLDFGKGGRIPVLMYEFGTGEISKISTVDDEIGMWDPGASVAIAKNMAAELIHPSSIIEANEKKLLKTNTQKLKIKLTEDDNPIVRIITFK